jgi:hypothetical protein
MRLQNPALSVEEREHQEMYAQLLKAVGTNEGSSHVDIASETPSDNYKELVFDNIRHFNDDNPEIDAMASALEWLYPGKIYDPQVATKNTILSTTNEKGM